MGMVFSEQLNIEAILWATPSGTPSREENEYKLSAFGPDQILKNNSYIIETIKGALERAFYNDLLWQAPKFTGTNYSVMQTGLGTFCFLDIYLDTPDGFNARSNISYRVRYRWHSRSALIRYLTGSDNVADFPHRCEYQLKIYGKDWAESFNNCRETRFEFRNDSFPFKTNQTAPPAPWPFEEFIKPAIKGQFGKDTIYTAYDYAKHLKQNHGKSGNVKLMHSLIVLTTRRRIHLGLKNEYGSVSADQGLGSAVNADQAILVTLDTSEIYKAEFLETYLFSRYARSRNSLTKRLVKRLKSMLVPEKIFTELEFEFERNIESALSMQIENNHSIIEQERLKQIKAAFLEDVKTTAKIVTNALAGLGIKAESGKLSKYRQAIEASQR